MGRTAAPKSSIFACFGQSRIFPISSFKSTLTFSPRPFNICTAVLYTHSLFVSVFLLHFRCHRPTSRLQLVAQHHSKLSFQILLLQKSPFTLRIAQTLTIGCCFFHPRSLLVCLATRLPRYSSKGCYLPASLMPVWIAALVVGSGGGLHCRAS